ncbi:MAG: FAD-binding protein [Lautropia sp.]
MDRRDIRRRWLKRAAALPLGGVAARLGTAHADASAAEPPGAARLPRVRPSDPDWPSPALWAGLRARVGDALVRVDTPWDACRAHPEGDTCRALLRSPQNPYFLGDDVALTQTFGWVGAWTSSPSVWAVAARNRDDVVAAVDFAREHRLRLVVKGGGHSYQGRSNAPDSLLLWTRRMDAIRMHEAFVPQGCEGVAAPVRAVSVGAGAIWSQVYDAVTTRGGGYVQGGGCMTVGVAGLVLSGGFGSFSKAFGTASASLLEAEIVTADARVRTVNACSDPELFRALKGGGGSFGVVTRVTLRVHPLPERFGAVNFTVKTASDAAFRRLVGLAIDFCASQLVGPHWGEQLRFLPSNTLRVSMVFQGIDRGDAQAVWAPFFEALDAAPEDFSTAFSPFRVVSTSARNFWAPTFLKRSFGFIARDDRPGAPDTNVFWPGDQAQVGQVLHGYASGWLPASLLRHAQRATLADALFEASRHAGFALHLNKGLAGASRAVLDAARASAMNPAVLDAFALVICAAKGPPAYPGVAGHEPDAAAARRDARAVQACLDALRARVPVVGAYLSESDYFQPDWQRAFWGDHYGRLLAVKDRVDPQGLFVVHHGVGSERWSRDGFTPLAQG